MRTGQTSRAVRLRVFVAALLAAAPLARAAQEPRSETEGIKETEQFIKAGGEVAHAAGVAKNQVQNTLTAYNNLMSTPSKNMKSGYGKLLKEIKEMDEKAADARSQVAEMEAAAKTYFTGRAATIEEIQNPQLKAEAKQRLAESQQEHDRVLAALRSAGESLDPIRQDLNDQVKFLGSDLNPGAAAALTPNAQKLNERGKANFAQVDAAISAADAYFNSMKPSK
jgi:hypothetical protein